jgi:hypothetical protein
VADTVHCASLARFFGFFPFGKEAVPAAGFYSVF